MRKSEEVRTFFQDENILTFFTARHPLKTTPAQDPIRGIINKFRNNAFNSSHVGIGSR